MPDVTLGPKAPPSWIRANRTGLVKDETPVVPLAVPRSSSTARHYFVRLAK